MSSDCLILNGNGKPLSYFPLSAVDWKTAVKLVFTRNVIVIKEHDNWEVRSPSQSFKVPSIVMLRKYYKFSKKVKFSRSNVFLRDMFTCQYCKNVFEKKDLTIDHIIPKSKGGETNWLNFESRIHKNMDVIFEILENAKVKATFFVVGWISDNYPNIVKRIDRSGFEIGSHSHLHQLTYEQNSKTFFNDLEKCLWMAS